MFSKIAVSSLERNLSLSPSNHLVMSSTLELNLGESSKHQNTATDTDRYIEFSLFARASHFNVKTMKRIFEQRSEL